MKYLLLLNIKTLRKYDDGWVPQGGVAIAKVRGSWDEYIHAMIKEDKPPIQIRNQ